MGNGEDGVAAPQAAERESGGLFVILRVDELPEENTTQAPHGLRIGEQLSVFRVVEGKSRDAVAREHRRQMDADWRALREGRDGVILKLSDYRYEERGVELPELFELHRYRVVSLAGFTPGHSAQEIRDVQSGTF